MTENIKNIKYYPGKILIVDEPSTIPDTIIIKNSALFIKNDINMNKILIERLEKNNPVTSITFKTRYVLYIHNNEPNCKPMDSDFYKTFDNTVISAFFNFLLEGL